MPAPLNQQLKVASVAQTVAIKIPNGVIVTITTHTNLTFNINVGSKRTFNINCIVIYVSSIAVGWILKGRGLYCRERIEIDKGSLDDCKTYCEMEGATMLTYYLKTTRCRCCKASSTLSKSSELKFTETEVYEYFEGNHTNHVFSTL